MLNSSSRFKEIYPGCVYFKIIQPGSRLSKTHQRFALILSSDDRNVTLLRAPRDIITMSISWFSATYEKVTT